MRMFAIAAVGLLAATAVPTAAQAQWGWGGSSYQRELRQVQRECRRDLRRADTRREVLRAQRECRRELAQLTRRYRHGGSDHRWRDWDDRWDDRRGRDWDHRWERRRDRDWDDD